MNDQPFRQVRQVKPHEPHVLSLAEARRAAKDAGQYLLWLDENQAKDFREPGWIQREPARGGGVLFVHPEREIRAARERGIL